MIHRQNWLDVRAYLDHMERRVGRDPQTIHKYRGYLRHLLEWADEQPFPQTRQLDPVYPAYLVTARADGKPQPLSFTSIKKNLDAVRAFFRYARLEWPLRYRRISESWISLLQPSRLSTPIPRVEDHQFYTLDELRTLISVSAETPRHERARVGAAMLFLSGMRPDALASLPVQCVDLAHNRILQFPTLGVHTKNNKAAITYLLPIPDLLAVVDAWHQRMQAFAPDGLWYAPLHDNGWEFIKSTRAIIGRHYVLGEDIRLLCDRAGIPYKSPYKMRHGHIVYARNLARDMSEVKAISQNVMHANMLITDQVYGALTGNQVQQTIASLGSQPASSSQTDIRRLIELLQSQLDAGN